jgi:hypothetical protein
MKVQGTTPVLWNVPGPHTSIPRVLDLFPMPTCQ